MLRTGFPIMPAQSWSTVSTKNEMGMAFFIKGMGEGDNMNTKCNTQNQNLTTTTFSINKGIFYAATFCANVILSPIYDCLSVLCLRHENITYQDSMQCPVSCCEYGYDRQWVHHQASQSKDLQVHLHQRYFQRTCLQKGNHSRPPIVSRVLDNSYWQMP